MLRKSDIHPNRRAMHQIYWSLLCNDTGLLDPAGISGHGPIHFGTYGNSSGKTPDSGRSGHLVAGGYRSACHWPPYARRRQFMDAICIIFLSLTRQLVQFAHANKVYSIFRTVVVMHGSSFDEVSAGMSDICMHTTHHHQTIESLTCARRADHLQRISADGLHTGRFSLHSFTKFKHISGNISFQTPLFIDFQELETLSEFPLNQRKSLSDNFSKVNHVVVMLWWC